MIRLLQKQDNFTMPALIFYQGLPMTVIPDNLQRIPAIFLPSSNRVARQPPSGHKMIEGNCIFGENKKHLTKRQLS